MHVLVYRVIRRSAVTYVGVRHETHGFEDFQRSVDRREVHPGRGVLDLRENLFGGSMSQILDRLEDQLALRCDAETIISKTLLPVLRRLICHCVRPLARLSRRRYQPSLPTVGRNIGGQ